MKKINIILLVVFIIGSVLIIRYHLNDIRIAENKMKEKVGYKVIIEKDTTLITNYSLWNNSFTLSNGKVVASDLIDKCVLLK